MVASWMLSMLPSKYHDRRYIRDYIVYLPTYYGATMERMSAQADMDLR